MALTGSSTWGEKSVDSVKFSWLDWWVFIREWMWTELFLIPNCPFYSSCIMSQVCTTPKTFEVDIIFQCVWNSLLLIKVACIWSNIDNIKITVFLFVCILKWNVFLWNKAEFSASLLQSSVSHDPSEIIIICWFAAQETILIINVENSCAA